MDNNELDRFCCNWDIQLRHSSRTIRRCKPTQITRYKDNEEFYKFPITEDMECYELLIPKDNFHALADIDKRLNEIIARSRDEKDYINRMRSKEMTEIQARNNNPAVKKAWDNYSTLMNLVYNDYADRY